MGGLASNLFLPIKAAYIKLFEINKYFAVLVLSVFTTFFLFVLMVTLISLGDSGLKDDKSVKLADIVMPEREIATFMEQVDKPDEPEEQPLRPSFAATQSTHLELKLAISLTLPSTEIFRNRPSSPPVMICSS